MKPVTLPLFKSLYYVLFATVVVIVLSGCEKDDENEKTLNKEKINKIIKETENAEEFINEFSMRDS